MVIRVKLLRNVAGSSVVPYYSVCVLSTEYGLCEMCNITLNMHVYVAYVLNRLETAPNEF